MFFEIYDLDLYGNGVIRLCVSFFIAEIINVEVELVCKVTPDDGIVLYTVSCWAKDNFYVTRDIT